LELPRYYVVFHGDYRYFPNREAVINLLKHVMPKIWKTYPDIHLLIIGPGISKFKKGNIISLGYLSQEELYGIISKAVCAIVPLLRGGGTRIKVLEYMACGVPVISTRIGVEGLEVTHLEHVLIAESLEDIPRLFELLIKNSSLRMKLIYNASILVKSKYDVTNVVSEVNKVLNTLIGFNLGDETI